MYCPQCGTQASEADAYCTQCGCSLKDVRAAIQPEPAATPVRPTTVIQTGVHVPVVSEMPEKQVSGKAIASLVLGIIGLVLWIIPFVNIPVGIVGIVLGAVSMQTPQRLAAIWGVILSAIGLILSFISGILTTLALVNMSV